MTFYKYLQYLVAIAGAIFLSSCSYVPDRLNPINWASSGYDWVMGEDDYYDSAPDMQMSRGEPGSTVCRGTDTQQWHNCEGTYHFSNGDQYVGGWENGKRTGRGTYIWPDGEKYVGDFRGGNKSGRGTYYFNDGEIWTGQFLNGEWVTGTKYGPGEAPLDLVQ